VGKIELVTQTAETLRCLNDDFSRSTWQDETKRYDARRRSLRRRRSGNGGALVTDRSNMPRRIMRRLGEPDRLGSALGALAVLCLLSGYARADDRYFVVVFASQGDINLPRFSHTFATFIKASGQGPRPETYSLETHTISWSPASMVVRAVRFIPEPGVNLDLPASLRWAQTLGAHISRWGPFEIRKELYDMARAHIARLEAGAFEYKTLDLGVRPRIASNCIHAVCDIDQEDGLLNTGVWYGEKASCLVVQHFRRWMINPDLTHTWIYDRLGLKGLPIEQRTCAAQSGR
jgi:hypothetical protein